MEESDKNFDAEKLSGETLQDENLSEVDSEYLPEDEIDETEDSEDESPNRTRNIVIGAVAVLLVGLALWFFFFRSGTTADDTATAETDVVVSVVTRTVETKTIAADASAVGTIFPLEQAVISSSINGQILEMPLLKNQLVSKGQVIAKIDVRDLQAQRAEAVSALREAELNLQTLKKSTIPAVESQNRKDLADAKAAVDNAAALVSRRKGLYEKGGIALKDLQDAELTLANAQNSLKLAERATSLRNSATNPLDTATSQVKINQANDRIKTLDAQISLATIRAPLTGFVLEQTQFAGEYATSGGKLLTIADTSRVVVKANFADTIVPDIKLGDAVAVFPEDIKGEQMSGKVSLISRSADPQNRAVEIWVDLSNGAGRLRLNSAAEVVISTKTQNNAVVVPNAAVTLDTADGITGTVMTVDADNIAHETKVNIGLKTKDEIQIVDGLQAGDKIIIEGNYNLPDGTKVEEKQNDAAADAPTSKPETNSNRDGN